MLNIDDDDNTIDINVEPGTKVVFNDLGGYDTDRQHAKESGLRTGMIYVMDYIDVGNWSSRIKLRGENGMFNSCMFDYAGCVLKAKTFKVNVSHTEIWAIGENDEHIHLTNIEILETITRVNVFGLGLHKIRYLAHPSD